MTSFKCKIVTPEGITFEKDIWQISIKSKDNSFAIRGRHADLIFATDICTVEIAQTPDSRETWTVNGLLLEFSENICLIVCKNAIKQ